MVELFNRLMLANGSIAGLVWVVVLCGSLLALTSINGAPSWFRHCFGAWSLQAYEAITAIAFGMLFSLAFWPTIAGWATLLTIVAFPILYCVVKRQARLHQEVLGVMPVVHLVNGR